MALRTLIGKSIDSYLKPVGSTRNLSPLKSSQISPLLGRIRNLPPSGSAQFSPSVYFLVGIHSYLPFKLPLFNFISGFDRPTGPVKLCSYVMMLLSGLIGWSVLICSSESLYKALSEQNKSQNNRNKMKNNINMLITWRFSDFCSKIVPWNKIDFVLALEQLF